MIAASDFDFIAGELPSPFDCDLWGVAILDGCEPECILEGTCVEICTTTTTSTTYRPSTSTTTTTLYDQCYLEGIANEVCEETTTTTSSTTECVRPEGLEQFFLITGHTFGGFSWDSTGSKENACEEMHFLLATPDPGITPKLLSVYAFSLNIGEYMYADNGTNDCECIPDGWYFTEDTAEDDYVFHVCRPGKSRLGLDFRGVLEEYRPMGLPASRRCRTCPEPASGREHEKTLAMDKRAPERGDNMNVCPGATRFR